nr:ScbA/BarX family gamma-butyrolactone biosynthesis protein [Streptomyces boncukensis]
MNSVQAVRPTPLPQELVHKHNKDEVLLTGWRELSPQCFEVTARWPRDHSFYLSDQGIHDPLMLVETVRQLLPLLSHVAYDVPLGHQLIWDDFSYQADPEALRARDPHTEVCLVVRCDSVAGRGGRTAAVLLHTEIFRGGERLGEAGTRFAIQRPAVYRRLRGERGDAHRAMADAAPPALPVPARWVGRTSPYDVVLSSGGAPGRWQLCVDTGHPALFDHPVDHVPGMLLLEAARQASQVAAYPQPVVPVAMRTEFHRYVELCAPAWAEAQALPADAERRSRVRVSVHQEDTVCCSTDVTVERVLTSASVLADAGSVPVLSDSDPLAERRRPTPAVL